MMRRAKVSRPARVRPGYWCRPKRLGWGATPVTWQGWLLTLAFVVLAAMLANTAEHRGPIWLLLLAPLVIGFIGLCWLKTDGGWAGAGAGETETGGSRLKVG